MGMINEKTTVPVTWVVSILSASLGVAIAGTCWVFSVNTRLARIEEHLGIKPYSMTANVNVVRDAFAETK